MARRSRRRSTPPELLVTTGSQQGLDLVARVLVEPGDAVLVELPTFTGAISAFGNAQAALARRRAAGRRGYRPRRPRARDGPAAARRHARRSCSTWCPISRTRPGGCCSQDRRRALLEWAESATTVSSSKTIPMARSTSRARYRPAPSARSRRTMTSGRVIYLSSFSKTLAPGFRVGWMAAPTPARRTLRDRQAGRRPGQRYARSARSRARRCAAAWSSGWRRACARTYRARRDAMTAALRARLDGPPLLGARHAAASSVGDAAAGRGRCGAARACARGTSDLRSRQRLLRRRLRPRHHPARVLGGARAADR